VKPGFPRLHAITDEAVARRPDLDQIARALAAAGGASLAFHARGHSLSGIEHYDLAVRLSVYPPAPLVVNDRLDVALAAGAAGVHLGAGGLPVAAARALSADWWIGKSVHGWDEARAALAAGADYLVVGPVYGTPSHPGRAPLGVEAFRTIAGLGAPVLAIGGVTAARVPELRRAGAAGVAAIRALWDAADPAASVRQMLEAWNE